MLEWEKRSEHFLHRVTMLMIRMTVTMSMQLLEAVIVVRVLLKGKRWGDQLFNPFFETGFKPDVRSPLLVPIRPLPIPAPARERYESLSSPLSLSDHKFEYPGIGKEMKRRGQEDQEDQEDDTQTPY